METTLESPRIKKPGPRPGQDFQVDSLRRRSSGLKKILFMTHHFPPDGNAPASRVREMCRRWVEEGYEVTVVTSTPDRARTVDGIKVIRVWSPMRSKTGLVGRAVSYLSYVLTGTFAALSTRRPDILIATSPHIFCGLAGILVKFIRRVPFVLEIRDVWPASISAVGAVKSRTALRSLEWLEQTMYRLATHIVTVGDGYKQQLVSHCAPTEKVSVITNGVDPSIYEPREPDRDLRASHGVEDKFVCAVVGTIGLASGLSVVLRAARSLKERRRHDIVFMLVGDGAVRHELQREAEAQGLDNVVFTGRQPKHLMPAYLSSVDACLVHLRRNGVFQHVLPSKIFEAAAMRRPIILGVDGFAATLVEDAGAGILIEPENSEQLVEAVLRLADDSALAGRFGESGRSYMLRHYNRDQLAQDYLDVLHSVCEGEGT